MTGDLSTHMLTPLQITTAASPDGDGPCQVHSLLASDTLPGGGVFPTQETRGGTGVPSHGEAGLPAGQADFGTRAPSQCCMLALRTVRSCYFS